MSQSQQLAYWYVDFATTQIRLADDYFRKIKYPETIDSAQDTMEFAIKAIFEFAGRSYPRIHDISTSIPTLRQRYPLLAHELSRAAIASGRWLGSARNIPRYGQQQLGVPPRTLYRKEEVRSALRDAKEVYLLMLKILKQEKCQYPRKIAILNGYVEGARYREYPCSSANYPLSHWRQTFTAKQLPNGDPKYIVDEITASQIRSQYLLIINPFGEAYPERDIKFRPVFNRIKDFVWGGGIFVTTGGFAFFYAWDVKQNEAIPITDTRTLIPSSIVVHPETGIASIPQYSRMLEFTGTLLWKELGALTTSDTHIHQGSYSMLTEQTRSDKAKVGNLTTLGGDQNVNEFRSLRKGTRNLIPLLRGVRPDFGEVYPIAAIKYGHGYFIICGMQFTDSEFKKAEVAADNFLEWFIR